MGERIWRVEFGWNTAKIDAVAQTIDEAIEKARKEHAKSIKEAPNDYWISKVELLAESDI